MKKLSESKSSRKPAKARSSAPNSTHMWQAMAGAINEAWATNLEAKIAVARLLAESRATLGRSWERFIETTELPFDLQTIDALTKIGRNAALIRANNRSRLPGSIAILHKLSQLSSAEVDSKIRFGLIHPYTTLTEATNLSSRLDGRAARQHRRVLRKLKKLSQQVHVVATGNEQLVGDYLDLIVPLQEWLMDKIVSQGAVDDWHRNKPDESSSC